MTAVDEDWTEVVGKLRKVWKSWARLERILGWEGANSRVLGFFKALVQAVLIFGLETWAMTLRMGRSLGSFQHGVARMIKERQLKIREEGGWEYPPLAVAMEEVGFEEIGDYILKMQNMIAI